MQYILGGTCPSPHLMQKGQLIPHSRWGRDVGSPAVPMGKEIRRPEFKSQPGYFSASDFSELQLPSTQNGCIAGGEVT